MTVPLPFRLVLASGSPARRDLLARAGCRFEVMPANIEEPTGAGFSDARTFVQYTAWLKAAAVAPRIGSEPAVVLAADTVAWLHGQPIGKPADREDAGRILRTLTGTEHELWTGVCLWRRPDDLQIAWQEVSRVAMRELRDGEIEEYLDSRQWEGCSGAYAIQEDGDPYVRIVQGSMSNVIGLPMGTTQHYLHALATIPLRP